MSKLCIELPDDISDETAFQLQKIFMDLALAVAAHCYGQIMRHFESISDQSHGYEEITPEDSDSDSVHPF